MIVIAMLKRSKKKDGQRVSRGSVPGQHWSIAINQQLKTEFICTLLQVSR